MRSWLSTILPAALLLIIFSMQGCATTTAHTKSPCSEYAAPSSSKIYLFLTAEFNPPEAIRQALENSTSFALLQLNQEVKIVHDKNAAGRDGMLLQVDIIGSRRGGVSKRIDIRYQLLNSASGEVMLNANTAIRSKMGYNKITVKLGRRIAQKVNTLLSCIQKREKQPV